MVIQGRNFSRREYIIKAQEIVKKEGVESISIRRLAKEMNCSTTTLYRHFDNLNELLVYAQLVYLEGYVTQLHDKEAQWKNIWEKHIGIWECYSRQAFRYPKAFDCIFFGPQSKILPRALQEYYDMFPNSINIVSEYLQIMLKEGSFLKRDQYMCRNCVKEGVISIEKALKLNKMAVYFFKGKFKTILDEGTDDIEREVNEVVNYIKDMVLYYSDDPLNISL
ncbi:MAG: TetR/AcrR family transcriptional regulator [Tissierellales bacterium]|jgi:AcrR family transcriptional regulator|nr:TetR/AcrR family transcriptional regulator [Tissierellales bacterium]